MTALSFTGPGAGDDEGAKVRDLPLASSPLEALQQAFTQMQSRDDEIRLPHPGAGHVVFVFDGAKVTDYDQLSAWAKDAGEDAMRLCCTMLANANVAIEVDGKPSGFTLASKELQDLTHTVDQVAAVKAFLNNKWPWIRSLANDLAEEASKPDPRAGISTKN